MEIKMMTHRLQDNLFIVSSDLKEHIERNMEPSEYINSFLYSNSNLTEIVEDKMLSNMTIMVPDREYLDQKIDESIEDWALFADRYLKD